MRLRNKLLSSAETKTAQVNFRLPASISEMLTRLAKDTGKTKTWVICRLIELAHKEGKK